MLGQLFIASPILKNSDDKQILEEPKLVLTRKKNMQNMKVSLSHRDMVI